MNYPQTSTPAHVLRSPPEDIATSPWSSRPQTPFRRASPCLARGSFACPIFQYDKAMGWKSVCNGVKGSNMSDVRRHLERSHRVFVKLCNTCNEDIIDQSEFENVHGGLCRSPVGDQRRGNRAEEQWLRLFRKLKPMATGFTPSPCESSQNP